MKRSLLFKEIVVFGGGCRRIMLRPGAGFETGDLKLGGLPYNDSSWVRLIDVN